MRPILLTALVSFLPPAVQAQTVESRAGREATRDSLVTLEETVVSVSRNATNLAATYISVDVLPA